MMSKLTDVFGRAVHIGSCQRCITCGAPVDTREVSEGGASDGAQLTSGQWVCSSDCWDHAPEDAEGST
jgi:hypothetical protein